MRIRTIKPEFWGHAVLGRMSDATRLLAVGLLSYADDSGYFYADPILIRNAIRPFDETCDETYYSLEDLVRIEFVEIVDHQKMGPIGRIINFAKHQCVSHPTPSHIKTYFDDSKKNQDDSGATPERLRSDSGATPEILRPEQGTGNREQGTGKEVPPRLPQDGKNPESTPEKTAAAGMSENSDPADDESLRRAKKFLDAFPKLREREISEETVAEHLRRMNGKGRAWLATLLATTADESIRKPLAVADARVASGEAIPKKEAGLIRALFSKKNIHPTQNESPLPTRAELDATASSLESRGHFTAAAAARSAKARDDPDTS